MVDIHVHILHGIDDGAKNLKDTIEMLKEAEKSGIKKLVATPHYIWQKDKKNCRKINKTWYM